MCSHPLIRGDSLRHRATGDVQRFRIQGSRSRTCYLPGHEILSDRQHLDPTDDFTQSGAGTRLSRGVLPAGPPAGNRDLLDQDVGAEIEPKG